MINDGSGNYTESSEKNFTNLGDVRFNSTKSGCIDLNGNKINNALAFDNSAKKVTVTSGKTVYCYLYFDPSKTADTLKSSLWSSGLSQDGYRYVGNKTDKIPDNYICFGTADATTCKNNPDTYMYRIIGVFQGNDNKQHFKLIKNTSIGKKKWNETDADVNWEDSTLYNSLNGDYFYNNTTYVPNTAWKRKIYKWKWRATNTRTDESEKGPSYWNTSPKGIYQNEMLKTEDSNVNCYNSETVYGSETCAKGTITYPEAYIGLMYASDYALSLGQEALNMTTGTYPNMDKLETSWMQLVDPGDTGASSWTITRYGRYSSGYGTWTVSSGGGVGNYYVTDGGGNILPVFYLTSDKVITGSGTESNPYMIIN